MIIYTFMCRTSLEEWNYYMVLRGEGKGKGMMKSQQYCNALNV
jgi:hypothetical protein